MGSTSKLAAGWGMAAEDFLRRTRLPIVYDHKGRPDLYSTVVPPLEDCTGLVMTRAEHRRLCDTRHAISPFHADLLRGGLPYAPTEEARKPFPERVQAPDFSDLAEIVADDRHILFWPDAATKREYFRCNDPLDGLVAMMHPHQPGKEWARPHRPLVSPLVHNPYPWSNDLQLNGERVPWPGPFGVRDYPQYTPAPPVDLVWWLDVLGVLSPEDSMFLRPFLCRWLD